MYRISPFTYLVSSVLSVGLSGADVECSDIELLRLPPPNGQNCSTFLGPFAEMAQSQLLNPEADSECLMCTFKKTDQFLSTLSINYDDRWRNVGLLFVYIVFNAIAAVFLYWLLRVPKKKSRKEKEE